ncbi:unnamed protein product [Strongylus vulgaris]|uniref:Uncharacterized protein n=1 Tax=Strongylus vulgaris TaxID=40348 RepID=A0A3P7IGS5_STRVU|nr:unnamed protein product [Strongylus vulgaris]
MSRSGNQTDFEKGCCAESRRISEMVEKIEMKAYVVERVVEQLQITCKNYYEEVGF